VGNAKAVMLDLMHHWLPDSSFEVFVGRHGAMNPAGRVRCNMLE
jgi:hypothetical protein